MPIRKGIGRSWRDYEISGSGSGPSTPIGPVPRSDWPWPRLVIENIAKGYRRLLCDTWVRGVE